MECKIITRKIVCSAIFVAFALFLCSAWAADPATRPGSFLKMLRDKRGLSVAGTLPVKSAHKKKTGTMPDAGKAASKKGTGETSGQGAGTEGKLTSIDFNNVDLAVFVKFISDLTGKNFVLDRGIRDKVTVICPSKIPVDEAYRVFESVLEVYGYTTVEAGDVIKIVKASAARSKNVIPLISKDSVLLAYESTNMLIVTDVYSNIRRLLKIIETIDVTGIGRQISVIPLEYADASKMVPILEAMFPEAIEKRTRPVKQSMAAGTGKVRLIADDRANAVIMMASEAETAKIKKLITILDRKVQKGKERIHVYYLKNADAEELAKVLQMLPEKETGQRNSPKKSSPVLSKSISVIADSATNSLIIMAERDDYLVLREIIKKLDIPRSMVYIECLIAEVNVTKSFELGAEWVAGDRMSYRGYDGAYGVGFGGGSDSGFSNFTQMAAGVFPSGFSVGAMAEPIIVG
ncbi:MAG: type II secretion system protein GspD, partial [Desulfococcus sp. 4484_241]